MDRELLEILCCPETRQTLALADPATLGDLHRRIAAGTLKNRGGTLVTEPIEAALVRRDRAWAYPVRRGVPLLLVQEGIPLEA